MKIGIIGLPQTGKKTLFEILSGHKPTDSELTSNKPIKAVAEIKDPRLDKIIEVYKPKKEVRARIDIETLPKIEKDTIAKGEIFEHIDELDAICHVVRAFKDESVYHIKGSVDPKRDIDSVNSELILHDLIFIEKRLERIEKNIKQTREEVLEKEKELLARLKAHLDKEMPLRLFKLTADEEKIISSYPFVTPKKMIIVLNVSEGDLNNTSLADKLKGNYQSLGIDIIQVSAKVESEIDNLETEEEREQFLKELGIAEPAINILTRVCIKALNLISFFTVASNEARQWTIKAGSTAPEAAGSIHTDMQRGFIRAEVMKYSDFEKFGSETKVKEAGKLYLKGKDYVLEDGDIINIRFNV